jgi:hypothetical protein
MHALDVPEGQVEEIGGPAKAVTVVGLAAETAGISRPCTTQAQKPVPTVEANIDGSPVQQRDRGRESQSESNLAAAE